MLVRLEIHEVNLDRDVEFRIFDPFEFIHVEISSDCCFSFIWKEFIFCQLPKQAFLANLGEV